MANTEAAPRPENTHSAPERLPIHHLKTMRPDDICELMKAGHIELEVDGALSEWGSLVDTVFQTLERNTVRWHEPGRTKSITLHFVEPTLKQDGHAEPSDIITLAAES